MHLLLTNSYNLRFLINVKIGCHLKIYRPRVQSSMENISTTNGRLKLFSHAV